MTMACWKSYNGRHKSQRVYRSFEHALLCLQRIRPVNKLDWSIRIQRAHVDLSFERRFKAVLRISSGLPQPDMRTFKILRTEVLQYVEVFVPRPMPRLIRSSPRRFRFSGSRNPRLEDLGEDRMPRLSQRSRLRFHHLHMVEVLWVQFLFYSLTVLSS